MPATSAGRGKIIAVVTVLAVRCSPIVYDVFIIVFCDAGDGAAPGVGEGRVAASAGGPMIAAHKEEQGKEWEDEGGGEGGGIGLGDYG